MHISAHSFVGASIAVAAYKYGPMPEVLAAAAPVAVASHCLMDKIGEPDDWPRSAHLLFDGLFMPLFAAILIAAPTDVALVALIGWFFGNLPDIVDKKGYLSIFFPDRFPATRKWFCHFKGYEAVQPPGWVTVALSLLLMAGFLLVVSPSGLVS